MQLETYRQYLQGEFEKRKVKNPFYSLRAFARDMDVSPSRLSEAINEKRGISLDMANRLIKKLGLDGRDADIFRLSVEAEHSRSTTQKKKAKQDLKSVLEASPEIPMKTFTVVDWVAEAVLKMSERDGVASEPEKIAHKLNVPQFMVVGALRFLTRLGLVKGTKQYRTYLEERGKGRRLNVDYTQILEQAHKAYVASKSDSELFHHQALLLDPKDMTKAQKLILDCFKNLQALEKKTKGSKVVFAAMQLFSIEHEGRM